MILPSERDKEATKRKLIQAVGEILKNQGHCGLGVNNIARFAGVNKKLIYRYFGTVDFLIETYIIEKDYWMIFADKLRSLIENNSCENTQTLITTILQNQFQHFFTEIEMQQLILWEISTSSPLMQSIHRTREIMGEQFLQKTDGHFNKTHINFRAVAALLVGGIYYTILHSRFNGGIFAGLDLKEAEGRAKIIEAIKQIVDWSFQQATQ